MNARQLPARIFTLVLALTFLVGAVSVITPHAADANDAGGDPGALGIDNGGFIGENGACGHEAQITDPTQQSFTCRAKQNPIYCNIEPADSTSYCITVNETAYGFSSTTKQGQINILKQKMLNLAATLPGNTQPAESLEYCGLYNYQQACRMFDLRPTTTRKINALAQQIRDIRNTIPRLVDACFTSGLVTFWDPRCIALRNGKAHPTVASTSTTNTTRVTTNTSPSLADILNGISSHFTLPSDITNNGQTISVNVGDLASTTNAALQQRIVVLQQLITTLQRVLELRQQLDVLQGNATST